jgi:hypothetical protein
MVKLLLTRLPSWFNEKGQLFQQLYGNNGYSHTKKCTLALHYTKKLILNGSKS